MSLLLLEGFDHYNSVLEVFKKPHLGGYLSAVFTTGGRFGSGCIQQQSATTVLNIGLPSTYTELWIGVGLFPAENTPSTSNNFGFMTIEQFSGVCIVYSLTPDYGINVYRGGGSLLGSSAIGITTYAVWSYIETYIKIDDSAGAVIVKVDGGEVINETGLDTSRYSGQEIQRICLAANNNQKTMRFDDLYVNDSEFMGEIKVVTKLPNANGTYGDFAPSAGTNYEMVDEVTPDDDATYNQGNALGDKDSFTIPTSGIDGEIVGVQLSNYARKTGTKITGIKNLVRVGGNDYLGDEEFLGTEYNYRTTLHEVNPDTSNPWNKGSIEAAEFGIEVTTLSTTTTT
jgi:hypothetical protein